MLDADLRAIITEDELQLKDDGIAPDNIKNDGIYSAYYIPNNNGDEVRYSLVCKIAGTEDTTVVNTSSSRSLPSHPSSSTPLCCGSQAVKVANLIPLTNTLEKSYRMTPLCHPQDSSLDLSLEGS